mmetsp:Transcript_28710/g.61798  ORF Transcript_28710/g.61798 Transcript_28710/m.61798 type:complete len:363 (-) Transcript_28710:74-1162(-)
MENDARDGSFGCALPRSDSANVATTRYAPRLSWHGSQTHPMRDDDDDDNNNNNNDGERDANTNDNAMESMLASGSIASAAASFSSAFPMSGMHPQQMMMPGANLAMMTSQQFPPHYPSYLENYNSSANYGMMQQNASNGMAWNSSSMAAGGGGGGGGGVVSGHPSNNMINLSGGSMNSSVNSGNTVSMMGKQHQNQQHLGQQHQHQQQLPPSSSCLQGMTYDSQLLAGMNRDWMAMKQQPQQQQQQQQQEQEQHQIRWKRMMMHHWSTSMQNECHHRLLLLLPPWKRVIRQRKNRLLRQLMQLVQLRQRQRLVPRPSHALLIIPTPQMPQMPCWCPLWNRNRVRFYQTNQLKREERRSWLPP